MPYAASESWDLENVFAGGVGGAPFKGELRELGIRISDVIPRAESLGVPTADPGYLETLPELSALSDRVGELSAYAHCLGAAHVEDANAQRAIQQVEAVATSLDRAWTQPRDHLARCSDSAFAALAAQPELTPLAPMLQDERNRGHLLLPPDQQGLVTELLPDGLHGWWQLYQRISGQLTIELNGESLSVAQAVNRLENADRAVRADAFAAIQSAWGGCAEACADTLSRIVGIRQVIQGRLNVDPLAEPLADGRITRTTLNAVMEACRQARPLIWRYLAAKAKLLGQNQLDICDIAAPPGGTDVKMTYGAAQDFIVEQFGTFSPELQDFANHALTHGWVEAENRGGKRPGGFCAYFPISQQSRIFMTFGGGMRGVATLAHELGHAYHNHTMRDLPSAQRRVPATLAETASTFAEAIVRDAAYRQAPDDAARLTMLDQDLQAACSFLVNIPIRFFFEQELYALRAKGPLVPEELSGTMERLQREWYGPTLGKTNPLFWASKLHFYLTHLAFYNFPYTFGYLFSELVARRARKEGPAWTPTYVTLLRGTGAGPAETLAQQVLGVDLSDPACWTEGLADLEVKVAQFEAFAGH